MAPKRNNPGPQQVKYSENGGLLRNQALDQEKYGQYILLRECLYPRLFMHLFRARFSYKLH